MPKQAPKVPTWAFALENGTVTDKSGYHQPSKSLHGRNCGCDLMTEKGAYRDVTIELHDGRTVYFYHQSAVVVRDGDTLTLDSHGYRTSTTKERINEHLPRGYYVRQEDFEWYLERPDDSRVTFTDGMEVTV